MEHDKADLLNQWHPAKNLPLTTRNVSYGSKHKIWWKCNQGHEWQTAVYTRTSAGSGCPVCAGKAEIPGENDLATERPDLAAQWHPTKNAPFTPEQVVTQSHKAVWMRLHL